MTIKGILFVFTSLEVDVDGCKGKGKRLKGNFANLEKFSSQIELVSVSSLGADLTVSSLQCLGESRE